MAKVHLLRVDSARGAHQGAARDGAGPGEPDIGRGRLAGSEAAEPGNGRTDCLRAEVLQPGPEDDPLRDAKPQRPRDLWRPENDTVRVRGADATLGRGGQPEASRSVRNLRGRQF